MEKRPCWLRNVLLFTLKQEEIWDQVEREGTVERKNEIKEEGYKILREKYTIVVEEG